jgi:hypothetical protein
VAVVAGRHHAGGRDDVDRLGAEPVATVTSLPMSPVVTP